MGFFERLKEGLSKTRRNFTDRIQELVGLSATIDDDSAFCRRGLKNYRKAD